MNNQTIHNFTIKRRGDNVYDIYVDKNHIASKGSIESVLAALKEIMEENV
jgi:hypothetical protein